MTGPAQAGPVVLPGVANAAGAVLPSPHLSSPAGIPAVLLNDAVHSASPIARSPAMLQPNPGGSNPGSRTASVSAPSGGVHGSRTASILSSAFSPTHGSGSDPSSRVNSVLDVSASRHASVSTAPVRPGGPEPYKKSFLGSIDLAWATRLELILATAFFLSAVIPSAVIIGLQSVHAASASRAGAESTLAMLAQHALSAAQSALELSLREVETAARALAAGAGAEELLGGSASLLAWSLLDASTGSSLAGSSALAAALPRPLTGPLQPRSRLLGPLAPPRPRPRLASTAAQRPAPSSEASPPSSSPTRWPLPRLPARGAAERDGGVGGGAAAGALPAALAAAGWRSVAGAPTAATGLALFAPSPDLFHAGGPAGRSRRRVRDGGAAGAASRGDVTAACAAAAGPSPLAGYAVLAWAGSGEVASAVREAERLAWIPALVGSVLAAALGAGLAGWIARPVKKAVEAVLEMLATQLRDQGWSGPPDAKGRPAGPLAPRPSPTRTSPRGDPGRGRGAPDGLGGDVSLPDSAAAAAGGHSATDATSGPPRPAPPAPPLTARRRRVRRAVGPAEAPSSAAARWARALVPVAGAAEPAGLPRREVRGGGGGPGRPEASPPPLETEFSDAEAAAPPAPAPPSPRAPRPRGRRGGAPGGVSRPRGRPRLAPELSALPPLPSLAEGAGANAAQSRRHSSLSTLVSVWERGRRRFPRGGEQRAAAALVVQAAAGAGGAAGAGTRRVDPGDAAPPAPTPEAEEAPGIFGGFSWYSFREAHSLHEALGLLRSAIQRATSVDRINERLELKVADRTRALQKAVERARKEAAEKERIRATLEKMRLHEAASMARSQFIASLNHELRTPLNAICGLTRMLLDTALDETQRDWLETVRSASETLLGLIADVLDYSKLECQKLRLEEQPFAIEDVVEESCELVAFKAVEKGLQLCHCVTWGAGAPRALLLGDSSRVRQILMNLLNNATKFSDQGSIDVRCSISMENPTSGLLRVTCSVTDQGIGIDKAAIDTLFQPFNQGSESIFRKYGGTGLGLSICKELCRLMGDGSISVSSEVGHGSTFTFVVFLRTAGAGEGAAGLAGPHVHEAEGEEGALLRAASLERPSVAGVSLLEWSPLLRGRSLLFYTKNETLATFVAANASAWGVAVVRCAHKTDVAAALQGRGTYAWVMVDMHRPAPPRPVRPAAPLRAGQRGEAMKAARGGGAGAWRAPQEVRERRASTWDEAQLRAHALAAADPAAVLEGERSEGRSGRRRRRGGAGRGVGGGEPGPGAAGRRGSALAAVILLTSGRRAHEWEREASVVGPAARPSCASQRPFGGGSYTPPSSTRCASRPAPAPARPPAPLPAEGGAGGARGGGGSEPASPRAESARGDADSELPAASWREARASSRAPSARPPPRQRRPCPPRARPAGPVGVAGGGGPASAGSFDVTLGRRHPLSILVAEDNPSTPRSSCARPARPAPPRLTPPRPRRHLPSRPAPSFGQLNFLRKLGYTDVALGTDGTQAIELLRARWRPVILMDIQMSPMGGVEATDRILAEWAHQPPAIFAVTANAMPADLDLYKRKGFSGCIAKPILVGDLVRALQSVPPLEAPPDSPRPALGPERPSLAPSPALPQRSLSAPSRAPASAPAPSRRRRGLRPPGTPPHEPAGGIASSGSIGAPRRAAAFTNASGSAAGGPVPGAGAGSGPAVRSGTGIFDGSLAQRKPLKILVCDDNRVNIKVALAYLKNFGYLQISVATSGKQAVECVRRDRPDVVLMDICMETSTAGVDAAEQIKAELRERSPVIIGVTGDTDASSALEYLRRGLSSVIHKPLVAEELHRLLSAI
eukprot:tig00021464_g21729.t1